MYGCLVEAEAEVTGCYELLGMCTKKGAWVLRENKYAFLATRPLLQPQNYIYLLTNQPRKLVQKEEETRKGRKECVLAGKPREEALRGRGGAGSRPGLS